MARRRRSYQTRRRGNPRALSLIAILFIFALTLAPPIKHYFVQRAQINALKSQLASDHAALDAARRELQLWKDPNYVKTQARERLHFVLPGERQYIVTGVVGESSAPQANKVSEFLPDGQPWYLKLIASITEAGATK